MYIPLNWQIDRVLSVHRFARVWFSTRGASNEQFLPLLLRSINKLLANPFRTLIPIWCPEFRFERCYFHVISRSSSRYYSKGEDQTFRLGFIFQRSNFENFEIIIRVREINTINTMFRFDFIHAVCRTWTQRRRYSTVIPKRTSSRNGGNFTLFWRGIYNNFSGDTEFPPNPRLRASIQARAGDEKRASHRFAACQGSVGPRIDIPNSYFITSRKLFGHRWEIIEFRELEFPEFYRHFVR